MTVEQAKAYARDGRCRLNENQEARILADECDRLERENKILKDKLESLIAINYVI